jgi:Lamin Tail Domain
MNRPYVFGLLLALSAVSSVPRASAAQTPSVILSEIAWAGSAQSTADEWIELANIGTESVPLGGWQLTGVGTSDSVLIIPAETMLGAGSTYLISNYAFGDPKSTLGVPSNLVTTAVSIPNTTLDITLIDSVGTAIDSLIDPGTPDSGSSVTFTSMERVLNDLSWASAETSMNLLNNQFGSPGVIGHTAATPIETAIVEEPDDVSTEIEIPIVSEIVAEPVADLEPVPEPTADVIEEVAIESGVDPAPAAIEEHAEETVVDSVTTEPITIPETIETIVEEPTVSETSPIETAVIVGMAPIEEPAAMPTEPEAVETTASEALVGTLVDEPEATAQIATIHAGDIIISSVFPSPNTGDDEWIALTNATDGSIDLAGMTLVDASGAVTTLGEIIGAQTTIRKESSTTIATAFRLSTARGRSSPPPHTARTNSLPQRKAPYSYSRQYLNPMKNLPSFSQKSRTRRPQQTQLLPISHLIHQTRERLGRLLWLPPAQASLPLIRLQTLQPA